MQKSLTKKETALVLSIIAMGTALLVAIVQSTSIVLASSVITKQDVVSSLPAFSNNEVTDLNIKKKSYYSLKIPKLSVTQSVGRVNNSYWLKKQWEQLEQVMQGAMAEYGVVAYPNSVEPGSKGSLYLTGHSSAPSIAQQNDPFTSLFKNLPELTNGDIIEIESEREIFSYQVESIKIVSANSTEILRQDYEQELLVLITCYPIGSTKDRLVVTARRNN